ncbi:hypothetical protein M413DRAFT_21569 [Hebeloma cylindrosporum]|uniref:Uncharacterized protein n=1 Tax=Hebeloma cylindrosporum TaxID=76867 RepID=A0A0C3CYT5_HEBCY|nr:hypothetical protein M413DRAFT_21569 [Hebeloma cylindrosporum h7]
MPPRPWTSRGARRPPRKFSHSRRARPKVKLKPGLHKLRLVRRYMRRKSEDVRAQNKNSEINAGASSQERPKHPALKVSTSESHNAIADNKKGSTRRPIVAEVTAVPNPTPDTGLSATNSLVSVNSLGAGSPVFDILSDTLPVGSALPIVLTPTPMGARTSIIFSALPPLLSATSSPTTAPAGTRAVLPTQTQPTSSASVQAQSGNSRSHQVPVAVVILLSVGSALLLLGICIVVRMCSRPRRTRPVPSLPILKDAESEDNYFETKDSPLFGGDERLSANPAGPLWTWVQFPHPKNAEPHTQNDISSQDGHLHSGCAQYTGSQAAQNLPSGPSIASQLHDPPRQPQLHTVAPAITFAGSRLSRASLGLYPPSAPNYSNNTGQDTVFTADGHDVIKRSKSKTASKRQSKASFDDKKRGSAASFIGLAYDGEDVTAAPPVEYNHVLEDSPIMPGFQGRTRVKSGYFAAGTYPRMSTLPSASYSIATATRINVGQRNSFSRDKFSPHRLNSKRLRDAQTLTCALGLASPRTEYNISSPQPTLYPDDSVSIMEPKRIKKKNANDRKPVEISPDMPVVVPMDEAMDINEALMPGASEASLTGLPLSSDNYGAAGPSSLLSRNLDKPPRVPSPPPLPSLTQMGLAHSNPEAYANYRSPTYSLYGLYESPDHRALN